MTARRYPCIRVLLLIYSACYIWERCSAAIVAAAIDRAVSQVRAIRSLRVAAAQNCPEHVLALVPILVLYLRPFGRIFNVRQMPATQDGRDAVHSSTSDSYQCTLSTMTYVSWQRWMRCAIAIASCSSEADQRASSMSSGTVSRTIILVSKWHQILMAAPI